jgi:N-acetylneuraminate synthase/N,N'-diacetyllegionaminate synthase
LLDIIFIFHAAFSRYEAAACANLGAIQKLKAHFPGVIIGYSDHSLGIEAATFAVAAGARIIEKHFTLDKNHSEFRDHQLSADPQDFRLLVSSIRRVEAMQGSCEITPQACEEGNRAPVRRSIAAALDLAAGTILTAAHITWVRPGTGIPPGEESAVLGRNIIRRLAQGEIITLGDLGPLQNEGRTAHTSG